MGALSPEGLEQRAMRGWAQSFGPPIAGKSQNLTMTAADQTLTLEGGAVYRIAAGAQPAFIGVADATVAGNREYVAANTHRFIQVPVSGVVLHIVQAATGGDLYVSKLDDVE